MKEGTELRIWGITDTGLIRRENQDAYLLKERTASGHTVCVVCDGMGGPAGGRMASGIAVTVYLDELIRRLTEESTPRDIEAASVRAVYLSNEAIRAAARENPGYRNMGTTLVSAAARDNQAVVTNVGDSRAYYITRDVITLITKDHSLVQDMVDRGDITPEQALHHPQRNVITRALGPFPEVKADCFTCTLAPDSWLLLCTDGLTNTVTEAEIQAEASRDDAPACLGRLVELARGRGAPDNVTAVLLENR